MSQSLSFIVYEFKNIALNPANYSQNVSCQVLELGQTVDFFVVNSLKYSHNFENGKIIDADDFRRFYLPIVGKTGGR